MPLTLYLGLDPSSYTDENEIVHVPIIEITPFSFEQPQIRTAFQRFDFFSHVIVTSKTTVDLLRKGLEHFSIPIAVWASKQTLSVGKGTTERLRSHGIEQTQTARKESAEGILPLLNTSHNARYFFPHSAQGRLVIQQFLQQRTASFVAVPLYTTRPCRNKPSIELSQFTRVVFTSPSTVSAFLEHFGRLPNAELVAIGPITERALEQALRR